MTANNAVVTELSARIPYSAEQGNILAEHGIFARKEGILSVWIQIITN
jgi:hypothetical protein